MKLAASTLFCIDKPLEESFEDILRLETRFIEIADAGHHALDSSRVKKLKELKNEYDLEYSIHAPYSDTNLSADDSSIRRAIIGRIMESIDYAKALDAVAFVFHPGWKTPVDRFMLGRTWKLNLKSSKKILEYASDQGVPALIENVPDPRDFLMKTVGEFMRFFDEIGIKSEMVLDIAHANIRGEIFKFIQKFSDRIKHVHVSDNYGDSDIHLPLGEGCIDWKEVVKELQGISFDGWIVVESYSKVPESLEYLTKLIS